MVYSSPMSFVLLKTNPLWTSPMPRLIMSPILPLIEAATTVARVVLEIPLVQPVVPSPILNGITMVVGVAEITPIDPCVKFVTNRVMLL